MHAYTFTNHTYIYNVTGMGRKSRTNTLIQQIKDSKASPYQQLTYIIEMCEMLSMASEHSLSANQVNEIVDLMVYNLGHW